MSGYRVCGVGAPRKLDSANCRGAIRRRWAARRYGLDLQLALYVCYELHYRGFAGVNPRWEWNPGLLHVRGRLEDTFLSAVRNDVGEIGPYETAATRWTRCRWNRSTARARRTTCETPLAEHLKEADLMDAAGLDSTYLAYVDTVSADALASVNLMSLFGLHRELRGAAIGHFASTEITSSPGSRRLVQALERMGAPEPCVGFYREHVEADAVHEQSRVYRCRRGSRCARTTSGP